MINFICPIEPPTTAQSPPILKDRVFRKILLNGSLGSSLEMSHKLQEPAEIILHKLEIILQFSIDFIV